MLSKLGIFLEARSLKWMRFDENGRNQFSSWPGEKYTAVQDNEMALNPKSYGQKNEFQLIRTDIYSMAENCARKIDIDIFGFMVSA